MKASVCPFCDTKQAYRYVAESENIRAIYPKSPSCKYHILLTPKRHVAHFDELNVDELLEIQTHIQKLIRIAKNNTPDFIGYNLLSNNGGVAVRQNVKHAHIHLFLRVASDTKDPFKSSHSLQPPELTYEDKTNLAELKLWVDLEQQA